MKLRVISGRLGGRWLTVPGALAGFRPTLERHRESVAQIIEPHIRGAVAVDLCAGSGVFGFELLSRGASHVDFVERHRGRSRMIREHARILGVAAQCRILAEDVRGFVCRSRSTYDIVFYDPPYADTALAGLLGRIFQLVAPGGILVYERAAERAVEPPANDAPVVLAQTRMFGISAVDIYERRT